MPKRSVYRTRVKERYKQLNIWDEFVEIRDRLYSFGLTPAQAFAEATEAITKLYPEGKLESRAEGPSVDIMGEITHDAQVARLVKATTGRDAAPLKVFTWVYNHAGIPWEDICPDDIPSPGAVYHLGQIKKDPKAYQKFLTDFAKLLPPKSHLEDTESRRSDDGRKVFALIDQMERELTNPKE